MKSDYSIIITELNKKINQGNWGGHLGIDLDYSLVDCKWGLLQEVDELLEEKEHFIFAETYIKFNLTIGMNFNSRFLEKVNKRRTFIENTQLSDIEYHKQHEELETFIDNFVEYLEDAPYELLIRLLTYFPNNKDNSDIKKFLSNPNQRYLHEILKNALIFIDYDTPKGLKISIGEIEIDSNDYSINEIIEDLKKLPKESNTKHIPYFALLVYCLVKSGKIKLIGEKEERQFGKERNFGGFYNHYSKIKNHEEERQIRIKGLQEISLEVYQKYDKLLSYAYN